MEMQTSDKRNLGVVVIDMQDEFLEGVAKQRLDNLIREQKRVMNYAQEKGYSIILVSLNEGGKVNSGLTQGLERYDGISSISKESTSAFNGTNLDFVLKQNRVNHLFLAGISACACVSDTAIDAKDKGYRVSTAQDVIADAGNLSDERMPQLMAISKRYFNKNCEFYESAQSFLECFEGGEK